jgi:diguanylate cyclase (GGDEF)-like protein
MSDIPEQPTGTHPTPPIPSPGDRSFGVRLLYAAALFVSGIVALTLVARDSDGWLPYGSLWQLVFFLFYGLFTIQVGYMSRAGHVSFDRIAQVASILAMGPVPAAWVNGLASLLWPLQRLREGRPPREVLCACLHNSGLMTLMILGCGQLYVLLSGPLPLTVLDARTAGLLLVLIVSMQLVNEFLMAVYLRLKDRAYRWTLHGFPMVMETGSALAGVLVAIMINRMELPVIALALTVLALAMIALNQFARMRNRLEALVDDRTLVLRDKMRELEELAARDQLTGLVNRRFADVALFRCIEEFNHSQRDFSIALIDLDHFKSINDRYSHETGDEVLRRVARILAAGCRQSEVLARYGGEEFLICFPGSGVAAAVEICEALRRAVQSADWSEVAPGIAVSLSAGVAGMQPGLTRSTLLKNADARLYRAKHAGRNRVVAS